MQATVGGESFPSPITFTVNAPVNVFFDGVETDTYGTLNSVTLETSGGDTFYQRAGQATITSSRLIPVDTEKSYRIQGRFRSAGQNQSRLYYGLVPYDEHGERIDVWQVRRFGTDGVISDYDSSSITTTTSMSGWQEPTTAGYMRHLAFYFDGETNRLPDIVLRDNTNGQYTETSGNVITLSAGLPSSVTDQIVLGTTIVKNHANGGSYIYCGASNVLVPHEWTEYGKDNLTGEVFSGSSTFWTGTRYVRLLLLANHQQSSDHVLQIDELFFEEVLEGQSANDLLPAWWKLAQFGKLIVEADADAADDGFSNFTKFMMGAEAEVPLISGDASNYEASFGGNGLVVILPDRGIYTVTDQNGDLLLSGYNE